MTELKIKAEIFVPGVPGTDSLAITAKHVASLVQYDEPIASLVADDINSIIERILNLCRKSIEFHGLQR